MLTSKIKSNAKKAGLTITETQAGENTIYIAIHDDTGCQITHTDAQKAVDCCAVLKSIAVEYPSVLISQETPDDTVSFRFVAQAQIDKELKTIHTFETSCPDKLRDECFESVHKLMDLGVEIEAEEEEEEIKTASVVPPRYRQIYHEVSDGTNCGDWLALTLNEFCKDGISKRAPFLLERFHHILVLNNVSLSGAWVNNRNSGWQGRFRMTGRNMLTKVVGTQGFLTVGYPETPDDVKELEAPEAWLVKNRRKA